MVPMRNETDTALRTMLCAARTQVVVPHWLLGVPELSELRKRRSFSKAGRKASSGIPKRHERLVSSFPSQIRRRWLTAAAPKSA
jgi:hypothetical protein